MWVVGDVRVRELALRSAVPWALPGPQTRHICLSNHTYADGY